MADTASTRMGFLSTTALPEALDVMSKRHDSLVGVVQYLGAAYMLAQHNKSDKTSIESEAKLYLNEALTRVASDIDTAAANLEQYLSLELGAVDSLAQQVACVQTNLALFRNDAAKSRLAAFVATMGDSSSSGGGVGVDGGDIGDTTENGVFSDGLASLSLFPKANTSTTTFAEHTIGSRVIKMDPSSRRLSLPSVNHSSTKRTSLAERIARLEQVGSVFDEDYTEVATATRGGENGDDGKLTTMTPFNPNLNLNLNSKNRDSVIATAMTTTRPDSTTTASVAKSSVSSAHGAKYMIAQKKTQ